MNTINVEKLESLFEGRETTIARDLKLNLERVLKDSALSPEEAALATLAVATSLEERHLITFARDSLASMDFSKEQIEEAAQSAAIMGMLNTYYRFRHMIGHSAEAEASYKTANLRMTSLAKPQLGKERFEMLAFAVSILNGCESCITSHEKALRDSGVEPNKIHDLARLASIAKGVKTLLTINL
jgi:alkyl hydroperoxide reductase subunit D